MSDGMDLEMDGEDMAAVAEDRRTEDEEQQSGDESPGDKPGRAGRRGRSASGKADAGQC